MEKIELKTPLELSELRIRVLTDTKESAEEFYQYIDILHSSLLNYQLIVDNVAYNIKNSIGKVKFK